MVRVAVQLFLQFHVMMHYFGTQLTVSVGMSWMHLVWGAQEMTVQKSRPQNGS
jgi:hypothetical protein